jgi:hypothetical protein
MFNYFSKSVVLIKVLVIYIHPFFKHVCFRNFFYCFILGFFCFLFYSYFFPGHYILRIYFSEGEKTGIKENCFTFSKIWYVCDTWFDQIFNSSIFGN